MSFIPQELASVFGPVVNFEGVFLVVKPSRVHLEDGGEAWFHVRHSTNIKAEPVVGHCHHHGLDRCDLAAASEDLGIHVTAIG